MAKKPGDELLRRLAEDLGRIGIERILSLRDRLRRYAGMPGVAEDTTRTAIREDLVIVAIADLLGGHPRPRFRILDACCGAGGLAIHLSKNLSDRAGKVAYLGIDQSAAQIGRARKLIHPEIKLAEVEYRVGEIWHLPTEWKGTLDLVVLSNTLHELPPHRFPELFEIFNDAIADDIGRVCLIDMEELPIGEPEAIAITWKAEEVEAFLVAAGFEVVPTSHRKSVGVFRVMLKRSTRIDPRGMLETLRLQLRTKLLSLSEDRSEFSAKDDEDDESLLRWLVVTGSMARCAEELLLVERRLDESDPGPRGVTRTGPEGDTPEGGGPDVSRDAES